MLLVVLLSWSFVMVVICRHEALLVHRIRIWSELGPHAEVLARRQSVHVGTWAV